MDRSNFFNEKIRPLIPFISITLVTVFTGIILIVITFLIIPHNDYAGEQVEIINLAEYTKDRPTDNNIVNYIKHELYTTIQANTNNINVANINDASIRDDTFRQKDDDETGLHTVSFLVDIPSIQQSYSIQYQWNTKDKNDVDEWGTYVQCPTNQQLVYPKFDCADEYVAMNSDIYPDGTTSMIEWTNVYQLNYNFSIDSSTKIRLALEKTLLSTTSNSRIAATLNETTFHTLRDQPNYTYTFDLNLDNDTTFQVIIRLDEDSMGDNYIVIYAKNITNDTHFATIITKNTSAVPELESWLRTYLNLPDLPITVQTPEELTKEDS